MFALCLSSLACCLLRRMASGWPMAVPAVYGWPVAVTEVYGRLAGPWLFAVAYGRLAGPQASADSLNTLLLCGFWRSEPRRSGLGSLGRLPSSTGNISSRQQL